MSFLFFLFSIVSLFLSGQQSNIRTFPQPIDAVSVALPSADATAQVRYREGSNWSGWTALQVENEQDPALRESNLVMLPKGVTQIEFNGDVRAVHPVIISDAPVHYAIAATTDPGTPTILTREEWGADETLRYTSKTTASPSSDTTSDIQSDSGTGESSQRIADCNTAQVNYPDEFKTNGRLVTKEDGHTLLWPRTYSKEIKLIVVHHTAMAVTNDPRSQVEMVRALYQYHAVNRGWGDVGYHYIIDANGQIYEGKAGGKFVIGGHAYCNNTNTLGVALMGNFDIEEPTQKQLHALQWLISDLSDEYKIDLNKNVKFHGKTMQPVVGHRDLLSTDCPGFYVYGGLSQILAHAAEGNLTADVRLPDNPNKTVATQTSSRKTQRLIQAQQPSPSGIRSIPRAVHRLLMSDASLALTRKLGTNPGHKTEEGVAERQSARLSGSSASSSVRPRMAAHNPVIQSSVRSIRSSESSDSSAFSDSSHTIRIRLTSIDATLASCDTLNLGILQTLYRGTVECITVSGKPAVINRLSLEDYMAGLGEEPDTEPYEKQRAFAIAARTYAAYYTDPSNRKFPNMPYDGSDSPATFQKYVGKAFEVKNPNWEKAVQSTAGNVLTVKGEIIKPPYFSSDDGRTRSPKEAGWNNFPFADVFVSKSDPWCSGLTMNGHGVGMSGCGAKGQANDGKTGEEILAYYYPGTVITTIDSLSLQANR